MIRGNYVYWLVPVLLAAASLFGPANPQQRAPAAVSFEKVSVMTPVQMKRAAEAALPKAKSVRGF